MKLVNILAFFVAMALAAGCVSQPIAGGESQPGSGNLQAQLQNTQNDLNNARVQLQDCEENYNATQARISVLTDQINALNKSLNDIQSQLNLYRSTFGATVYDGTQPQEACGSGNPINLISNPQAVDVSWQNVREFLESDKTTYLQYTSDYVCCDYASKIYNDAEAHGIRTAFVIVHFSNRSPDHAINAFLTTDDGLVYTDSTGQAVYKPLDLPNAYQPGSPVIDGNKIAYVAIGKPLGFVSIRADYGTTYDDYEQWTGDEKSFEADVNDYLNQVAQYNSDPLDSYNSGEYTTLLNEKNQLDNRAASLGIVAETGYSIWPPLGPVSGLDIYW